MKSAGKMMVTVFWDARGIIHRLPSVEANDQWRKLCSLIGPFQQHFKEKTFSVGEEESTLPSRQCTGLHVPDTDGQISLIPL